MASSKTSFSQYLRLPEAPHSLESHILPELQGQGNTRDPEGIREGSGFHKQEERRGGGRYSALKIDLQALQRGPAPEIGRGGGLGCPGGERERK